MAALGFAVFGAAPALADDPPPAVTVIADIPAISPNHVASAAFADGVLWVAGHPGLFRIDVTTNQLADFIPMADDLRNVAVGFGSVWIANFRANTVTRVDASTDQVLDTFSSGGLAPVGIAVNSTAVWVTNAHPDASGHGSLVRIDPVTDSITAVVTLGSGGPFGNAEGVASGAHSLWVAMPNLSSVARVDESTLAVTVIPLQCPGDVVADDTGAWVGIHNQCNSSPGAVEGCAADCRVVSRIDAATDSVVARVKVGGSPISVAELAGSLWVEAVGSDNSQSQQVLRVDPVSHTVIGKTAFSCGGAFLVAGASSLWTYLPLCGGDVLRLQPAV